MKYLKKKSRELILLAVILVIGCIVSTTTPFFTKLNIINILYGNAAYGIMAIGMMLVITTGNIDISVGPQMAATSVICGLFVVATGGKYPLLSVLIAMAVGLAVGLFNGTMVALLNIPAIVVTLGSMNIIRGVIYLVSNGEWVEGLTGSFVKIAGTKIIGIQAAIWVWALIIAITYFFLYRTKFGRDILAVGGNADAAMRVGISKIKVYLFAFGYLGTLVGLASAIQAAKVKSASPSNGAGTEMQLIAACVIGGTEFTGGISSIAGTTLGVILLGVIKNGLVLAKVPVYWQNLATGVIIILAVASSIFNSLPKKKKAKKEVNA